MKPTKEFRPVRYAYGVAVALLLGGTAFSALTGQAGSQVAQNAPTAMVPNAISETIPADSLLPDETAALAARNAGIHVQNAYSSHMCPR